MLMTVALVMCLLGGAVAQDPTAGRIAYMQLMSRCIGETQYREYLEAVAAAQRECGGGVGDGGFSPGLANVPVTPSLAAHFPTVQQPGVVVVPRPGDFGQRQDVLLQQSRLVPQRPELFPTQQPGVFSTQTGIITQQPGSFFPSPFSIQSPGGTPQPGIFPDASGINLVNTQSSTSPTAAADSVPLIRVGPSSYRGVREKRQVSFFPSDIQQTIRDKQALIGNFKCVLTKLAVVNSNLDLNYQGLIKSVLSLRVAPELIQDLRESIDFCRELTACLPPGKQKSSEERKLQRIVEYVKCEKEMRLKACNKHNLRQNLKNRNLGRSRRVEEVVDLIEDGLTVRELELI